MFSAEEGVAMCLPDFEPVSRFLIEGLRRLGQAIDNWLDVTTLIIQVFSCPPHPRDCPALTPCTHKQTGGHVPRLIPKV